MARRLRTSNPVNFRHSLNRGLTSWHRVVPWLYGGKTWFDLTGGGYVTSFNIGWRSVTHPGGSGSFYGSGQTNRTDTQLFGSGVVGTMAVWFKPDGTPGSIVTDEATSDLPEILYSVNYGLSRGDNNSGTGDYLWYWVNDGSTPMPYAGGFAYDTGGWNHLLVTDPVNNATVYLNGLAIVGPFGVPPQSTGSTLSFGVTQGWFDDLKTWNRVLSPSEVRQEFRESRAGSPNTLNWVRSTTPYLFSGTTAVYFPASLLLGA